MAEEEEEYEDDYEDGVLYIQYTGGGIEASVPITELGKTIFLTIKEAQRAASEK